MTFTDIVDRVCLDLNLRGDETVQRVGKAVNKAYLEVLRALGMNVYTRTEVDVQLAANSQDQIYDLDNPTLGRLVALFWTPTATSTNPNPRPQMIDEITYEEMKTVIPTTADRPMKWCKVRVGANWTQFKIDSTIPNGCTVTIEGEEMPTELEGDMQPGFEGLYHPMLVDGAEAEEYARIKTTEARAMATAKKNDFEKAIGELRLRQTLMAAGVIKQGKYGNYVNRLARRGPATDGTY
jgi:hypothetical protein